MNSKQIEARQKRIAASLFAKKKIGLLEYGAVLIGRGSFDCNKLRTYDWSKLRQKWVVTTRFIKP